MLPALLDLQKEIKASWATSGWPFCSSPWANYVLQKKIILLFLIGACITGVSATSVDISWAKVRNYVESN
jgi:hypothetical protein